MSRFDYDAYDKVFPREVPATVDTAVEGFTPTADIKKATDNKPGDDILKAVDPEPDNPGGETPNTTGEESPKGE